MNKKHSHKNVKKIIINVIFIVIVLLLVGFIIYRYLNYGTLESIRFLVTILILVLLIYFLYYLATVKMLLPESLSGKKLPTTDSGKGKVVRLKNYAIRSGVFAVILCFLDIIAWLFVEDYQDFFVFANLGKEWNVILNVVIMFGIAFVISFILEFFIGELSIKRFNAKRGKVSK